MFGFDILSQLSSIKQTMIFPAMFEVNTVIVFNLLHFLKLSLLNTGYFLNVEIAFSIVSIEILFRTIVFVYLNSLLCLV